MTILPFPRQRASGQSLDLTAFWPAEPPPQPRSLNWRLLAALGSNLLFWAAFATWVGFLLKVW